MARLASANDIMNRTAVEVGLSKVADPFNDTDDTFEQLVELLNAAGQELVELHPWQILRKEYQVITVQGDSGEYALPDDFAYMIDQTGWERKNTVPLGGPLSAQDWTYLLGRDLVSQTIYASFRLFDNKFNLFPSPAPAGLDVNFEYISRNWIRSQDGFNQYDILQSGSNVVLYEPILIVKYLKAKFLSAKGFDTTQANMDFENMFNSRTGKDEGAPILSASNNSRSFPYLQPYINTGDTGFGLS